MSSTTTPVDCSKGLALTTNIAKMSSYMYSSSSSLSLLLISLLISVLSQPMITKGIYITGPLLFILILSNFNFNKVGTPGKSCN